MATAFTALLFATTFKSRNLHCDIVAKERKLSLYDNNKNLLRCAWAQAFTQTCGHKFTSAVDIAAHGSYVMYGHILCPQYILCPILYIQYPTHTYRAKQGCTQLYTAIHCYKQLYTAIQS